MSVERKRLAIAATQQGSVVERCRALELALNQLLALDPDTRDAVRRLDGRHVVVRLAAPELALRLDVDGDRLRVGAVDADADADLSVRGTLAGLLAQLPLLQRSGASGTGRVRIEGDADLARQLQQLARGFDPDWQAPFVRVFGEVAGVQVADLLAAALRRADVAGRNLAGTTAEFLTEESRDLVGRNELEAFLDDVDALRDGVERVEDLRPAKRAAPLAAVPLMGLLLFGLFAPATFTGALGRLLSPTEVFTPPAPFSLAVSPGDVELVRGDDLTVEVAARGRALPRQATLVLGRADEERTDPVRLAADSTGAFRHVITNVRETLRYRVEAEGVRTDWFTAEVVARPMVQRLQVDRHSGQMRQVP